MNRLFIFIYALLLSLTSAYSTSLPTYPHPEKLDRGFVAYRSVNDDNQVCISWRYFSADRLDVAYNIYRTPIYASSEGTTVKLNSEPITKATFFSYENKSRTTTRYMLKEVVEGVESADTLAVYLLSSNNPYIEIPMKQVSGDTNWNFAPNDVSAADLDGDGQLEIVVHRAGTGYDNSQSGISDTPVLQAYKLDGTFLWEINLGINIREGAHYTQFMVYDLDGDGKAEVVCKTAEGTKDSKGKNVGQAYFPEYKAKYGLADDYNANADYRNANGYILSGPEFLTVFDGKTGEEVSSTEYDPPRYSTYNNGNEIPHLNPSASEINSRWGDNYGNRVDRFLACVAYLGGDNHSVVMCRGYYTRTVLVAYDYVDKKLVRRWKFDTWNNAALSSYTGQGNHNLRVADVDKDGYDEIVYGSMTVDHDGKGLYSTRLGHGDALHIGDFIPKRPGLEVLGCHEDKVDGTTLRDAATGEVLYQIKSGDDVGRCLGADIDPTRRGMEFWSARSGGILSSENGVAITTSTSSVSMNMACWWDGDLLRELQDGTGVSKYNYQTKTSSTLLQTSGTASNNGTKANPCLQADILGDWREEVVLRASDNKSIRIYLTPYETNYRFHSFLEDPVYRMSVAYQNVSYNQPTSIGFYIGSDLENIFEVKDTLVEGDALLLDPVFDGLSYKWSTGETTKQIVLTRDGHQPGKAYPISLELNFRGHVFKDTLGVTFKELTSINKNSLPNLSVRLLSSIVDRNLSLVVPDGSSSYSLQIQNLEGKQLLKSKLKADTGQVLQWEVSQLPKGIYILAVTALGIGKNSFVFVKK